MKPEEVRQPTPQEQRRIDQWRASILKGRKNVEKMISAAALASYGEYFRISLPKPLQKNVSIVFSAEDQRRIMQLITAWNFIEVAYAFAESGRWGVQLNKTGDLDIVSSEKDPDYFVYKAPAGMTWPAPGVALDGFWIPLIILAIVISGAVVTTKSIDYYAGKEAVAAQQKLSALNLEMAQQPPDVRASWAEFQKSNPYAQEKSAFDKLFESVGNLGPFLLIGAVALVAVSAFSKKASRTAETVRTNPRRRRRRKARPFFLHG